jgi:hypothetical protein
MALMVTDSYSPAERKTFREGMRKLDMATKRANNVTFMAATPQQRLAVLGKLDREQKRVMDAREAAERKQKGLAPLPTNETAMEEDGPGVAISGADADIEAPAHYFRMMKELALLGYFTSEIGCTRAQRYVETPGRYDPCLPYAAGEPAWAAHP